MDKLIYKFKSKEFKKIKYPQNFLGVKGLITFETARESSSKCFSGSLCFKSIELLNNLS